MQTRQVGILLAVLSLAFTLVLASPVTSHAASSTSQGYVKYNIVLTNSTEVRTFTITESVQPSQTPGQSLLTVEVSSQSGNLTYSRLENSSRIFFPILPVTSSQSFNYQTQGVSFDFSITRTGTTSTIFNGNTVQLTAYSFQGAFAFQNIQMKSVTGQLSVLPSDLLYSVQVNISPTMSLRIRLLSTSIALDSAAATSPLTSQIIFGGSIAGIIIAIGVGVFYGLRKLTIKSSANAPGTAEKPSYWVD